jgi:hypothetical protein
VDVSAGPLGEAEAGSWLEGDEGGDLPGGGDGAAVLDAAQLLAALDGADLAPLAAAAARQRRQQQRQGPGNGEGEGGGGGGSELDAVWETLV